ncbi:glycosyltransferase [Methanobrevibacter oralis]|uniref:glycosyltransferase n=1 Tax=Methanobrevibacter oralis TaxID=66851 RepID=UPI001C72F2BD|nr:glycosyltransferase [Methanobrevibacter oralis]
MSWLLVILTFLLAIIKTEKTKKYQKISVIIPAFNEEKTVASVVEVVKNVSYIDEIIVVNDGSSDNTELEAKKAGATVINHNTNKGKGEALCTGYLEAKCDIIAFIDADIHNLTSSKVDKMLKPILLGKADITKTKFSRASGRVTELTAKPLLNYFFPEISFAQPLSGQFAAKKEALKRINFEKDYGVDVGIVIDADVLGLSVLEVDIGAIEHDMSPLEDLNLMANEVVRTIMDRANKYGRVVMIDDIGHFIRMSVVGLSLIILGLFTIFFVNPVPLSIGVIISIIGIIIAIYYIIKVILQSISMYKKTPRGNLIRSFIKIHFSLIISMIILILMISTFIGAAHFEGGVISIEPSSRNLIIYAGDDSPSNNTISVRGPYTVDLAIENESDMIRVPYDAMATLGVGVNDTLIISGEEYTINQTRDGEPNMLRVPIEAKNRLNVEVGDVIQNSLLTQSFEGSQVFHNHKIDNFSFAESFIINQRHQNSSVVEIMLNNSSIANFTGKFIENNTYSIAFDGEVIETIKYNNKTNETSFKYDNSTVKILFKNENITSTKTFINAGKGNFINFK